MDQPRLTAWTRRRVLRGAAGLAASAAFVAPPSTTDASGWSVSASGSTTPNASSNLRLAPSAPLIEHVTTVCRRLAPTAPPAWRSECSTMTWCIGRRPTRQRWTHDVAQRSAKCR